MNRKQRRASGVKGKVATYNFTEEQLKAYVEQHYKEYVADMKQDTLNDCMILMLTLPMEVLMDHYWKKSYRKKIPEFISYVLDYFAKWENGELDINELKKDLWEHGGVRLEKTK